MKDELETIHAAARVGGYDKAEPIDVRVKRGEGADYVQSGRSMSEYDIGLHDLFRRLTWEEIKEQGLNVQVRDEDPAAHS